MFDFNISLYANFYRQEFVYDKEIYDEYVIFALKKGSFKYRINNCDTSVLSCGEILICPPNVTLYRKIISPAEFYMIKFNFTDDTILPSGKALLKTTERFFYDLSLVPDNLLCTNVYENTIIYHFVRDALFCLILDNSEKKTSPVEFSNVISYISAHLRDEISNTVLAELYGYSVVNFINRFKTEYGCTPHNYIILKRIEKARTLLTETNLPIKQIAYDCGYPDELYFSRIFKKNMNCSPKEYRKLSKL